MIKKFIQTLKSCKYLEENDVQLVCQKVTLFHQVKQILVTETNVVKVSAPIIVCGDIHGQFHDLLELFEIGGLLPYTNYIFMGDYVDRGYNSVETFSLILCYKLMYKDKITILRGNHQNRCPNLTRQINKSYGFYDQCFKKYGNQTVWKMFTQVFQFLPLSALVQNQVLIDKQFFCLHGGLSPSIQNLDLINQLDRFKDIPHQGSMCDLLWSDPDQYKPDWSVSPRGAGWIFGLNITQKFIQINNIKMILRAHQLGYYENHKKKCITIFSAPNYCYRCSNQASIMNINDVLQTQYIQFEPAERDNQQMTTRMVPDYFL